MKAFHECLVQVGDVQLRWNVVGVGDDGRVDPGRFKIHLFAVDLAKGRGGFDAPLSQEDVRKLHSFLAPFVEQLPRTASSTPFRVVEVQGRVGELLDSLVGLDKPGLGEILSALHDAGRFEWLAENIGQVEGEELEAALRHARRRKALESLKRLVTKDVEGDVVSFCKKTPDLARYSAGQPETVFQRWFEANSWILGREYIRRHPLRVIGLDSEADLILETADGFLDLVELKRPSAKLLASKTSGRLHAKFHYPHSEFAQAYGQCVRYLADLEAFRHRLEEMYDARIVAPRVYLVSGRRPSGEDGGQEALRRICATFHQIDVLSYDDVINTGEALLSRYSNDTDDPVA